MLRKLMKYEWKATYKVGCGILLAMLALTIVSTFVVGFGMQPILQDESSMFASVTAMIAFLAIFAFMMLMSGALYGVYIYLGVRFHKSMYGKEGYLTQTLPVNSHQLLISKMFVSGAWVTIINAGFVLSLIILVLGMVQIMVPDVSWGEMIAELVGYYPEINEGFKYEMGISLTAYLVIMLIISVINPFALVVGIFGSITMGQLFRKYKGLMGALCCLLYFIVYYIAAMIIALPTAFAGALAESEEVAMSFSFMEVFSTVIVLIVLGIVMYFVAHYVNTKKLNME